MNSINREHSVKQPNLKNTYLVIGLLFVVFFLVTERALAENFRDQEDRMRNEYHQQQDMQREMSRVRDHQELRDTQSSQQMRYQEQNVEIKNIKQKLDQRAHPYEPEIITHDRGEIQVNENDKELKTNKQKDIKHELNLPKINMDRLLEGQ